MGRHRVTDEHVVRVIRARLQVTPDGCLEWMGARDPNGYGRVGGWRGRSQLAHRALWEAEHGRLDPQLQLDHLCRNPPCVNPEHLEPVTAAENTRRSTVVAVHKARAAARAACDAGHTYTEQTLRQDSSGRRHCRVCDEAAQDRRTELRRQLRIQRYGFDPGPFARFRPGSKAAEEARARLVGSGS